MSKFDWRAELGDILSMPAKQDEAASQATTVLLSCGVTQPPAAPQDSALPPARARAPRVSAHARQAAPRWVMWLAGLALLLLLAMAVWRSQGDAPSTAPTAAPAAAPAPVAAPEPAASAVAAVAVQSGDSPTGAASAALAPSPGNVPQPVTAGRKAAAKPMAKPVAENRRLTDDAPVVLPAAPAAARLDAAEAAARKTQAAGEGASAPAPTRSPETVCADRNFLVRPMCLYQECQKPEFSRSALCQENARRLRESRPARD